MFRLWREDSRLRRLIIAAVLYGVLTAVYFVFATRSIVRAHTPWNHFALLAEGWLHGRLHLDGAPPAYAGNNDFAEFQGKWFVTFPPFPALLLLPMVKLAGSAARVQDGQFFLWLAGIGPSVLFLGLEKLRRMGQSQCSTRTNVLLTLLFAFGTVYFFTAVQGTVWFSAHVVGVALAAAYLLFALEASHPLLAGLTVGLGFMTRSPLLFAVPLFALEAVRVCLRQSAQGQPPPADPVQLELPIDASASERSIQLELPMADVSRDGRARTAPRVPAARSSMRVWFANGWRRLDKPRVIRLYILFSLPLLAILAISLWHNYLRFGEPFEVGYRYLTVAWRDRMGKWGLFHYHYLARNVAVVVTSLPWWPEPGRPGSLQINAHGLALWLTTPAYFWLLWPRKVTALSWALWLTVIAVGVPSLLYQNTGWLQFGYRFSNDYSVFLFALMAIGGYRFKALFWTLALWAVLVNCFGAVTFGRPEYQRFYYQDASQRTLHQPD